MRAQAQQLGPAGRVALVALILLGGVVASIDPFTMLFFGSYGVVGAVLAWRRPRNLVGWLLIAISFGFVSTSPVPDLDVDALAAGTASTGDFLLAWVSAWGGLATLTGFVALGLLFPTGDLPPGRWGSVARVMLGAGVALVVVSAFSPTLSVNPDGGPISRPFVNRLGIAPDLPLWEILTPDLLFLPLMLMLVLTAVSMVVRYRRSTGVLRLQLRWLVAALTLVVAALMLGLGSSLLIGAGAGGAEWVPAVVAYPLVPIAIAVAVLRYRLYEIDRIISRTLGWALVSAAVAAVFALGLIALQGILADVTRDDSIAIAASTLAAVAAFQPLRSRIQSAVDRRFDRTRYDRGRMVSGFAELVRNEVDQDRITAGVGEVVVAAVRPTAMGIWLRAGDRGREGQEHRLGS